MSAKFAINLLDDELGISLHWEPVNSRVDLGSSQYQKIGGSGVNMESSGCWDGLDNQVDVEEVKSVMHHLRNLTFSATLSRGIHRLECRWRHDV